MKNDKHVYIFLIVLVLIKALLDYLKINNISFTLVSFLFILAIIIMFFVLIGYGKKIYNRNKYNYIYERNAVIYIIIYFILIYSLGFITGFLKNAYSYTIAGIITNFGQLIIFKLMLEIIRYNFLKMNKSKTFCFIVSLAFVYFYVNIVTLVSLSTNFESFKYICKYVIPIISMSIISTYTAKNGSLKALLIIQIIPALVSTYAYIQPDINYYITGVINIVFALSYYIITKYQVDLKNPAINIKYLKKSNPIRDIPIYIIITIVICFVIGFFNYVPISVMSNSMYPYYQRCDLLVYKKISDSSNLKIDDIICYRLDNVTVMHRIVKIETINGETLYTTKGDNVNHNDIKRVTNEQIIGIIELIIPKCGYPSVWLYELLNKG